MQAQSQNDPIINLPNLYKYGLVLSNNVNDPDGTLNISAGMCRDSNNVMDIELNTPNVENEPPVLAPILLNTSVNGANGLDVGSLDSDIMYAVYMIADSRYYKPTASIMTLATNKFPLLPAGYDSSRLIGYWGTDDSSHLEQGIYQGISNDMVFWYAGADRPILAGGNATVRTHLSLNAFVPPIDGLIVTVFTQVSGTVNGQFFHLYTPGDLIASFFQIVQVAATGITNQVTLPTRLVAEDPTIDYLVNDAAASLTMWITGFEVSV